MPELPEVEVVKKSLEREIYNLMLKDVKIIDGNLRYKLKISDIKKIIGSTVQKIERRSKYLLFFFDNGSVMLVHLGMTGKFYYFKNKVKRKTSFYYETEDSYEKHNRLIFIFSNKFKLVYNDVRKFGFIKIDNIKNLKNNKHLKILGPEPNSNLFNHSYFVKYINGRNRTIKNLLMDQKFVSGLGNIYVNEILFSTKIKPSRKVKKLKFFEIKRIIVTTKKILNKAITFGGSSIKDFSSSSGKKGSFQQYFNVYGKKGFLCSNSDCKASIKKIVINNRASFFCPKCQK